MSGLCELGDVAIGHLDAIVAQQLGELTAGLMFAQTSGHTAMKKGFGERGAQTVQALGGDSEFVAGLADSVLQPTGQDRAVGPEPVTAGGDRRQGMFKFRAAGVIWHNEALAAAFGVAAPDTDYAGDSVEVVLTQASELVMAQSAGDEQADHALELRSIARVQAYAAADLLDLADAVATARGAGGEAGVQIVGDELIGAQFAPALGLHANSELAHGAEGAADSDAFELALAHGGDAPAHGFGGQIAEELGAQLGWEVAEQGIDALLDAAVGVMAENALVGLAGGFGGVAAAARSSRRGGPVHLAQNEFDLAGEAGTFTHEISWQGSGKAVAGGRTRLQRFLPQVRQPFDRP